MRSLSPAARTTFVFEETAKLQRLHREMTRRSPRDRDYENKMRALQAVIRELQKTISAHAA